MDTSNYLAFLLQTCFQPLHQFPRTLSVVQDKVRKCVCVCVIQSMFIRSESLSIVALDSFLFRLIAPRAGPSDVPTHFPSLPMVPSSAPYSHSNPGGENAGELYHSSLHLLHAQIKPTIIHLTESSWETSIMIVNMCYLCVSNAGTIEPLELYAIVIKKIVIVSTISNMNYV